jgi:arylsulfatase A-like enzyme
MPGGKPNVLIILCDDLGWSNASCYHQGVMASPTPNIDRIAAEGVRRRPGAAGPRVGGVPRHTRAG